MAGGGARRTVVDVARAMPATRHAPRALAGWPVARRRPGRNLRNRRRGHRRAAAAAGAAEPPSATPTLQAAERAAVRSAAKQIVLLALHHAAGEAERRRPRLRCSADSERARRSGRGGSPTEQDTPRPDIAALNPGRPCRRWLWRRPGVVAAPAAPPAARSPPDGPPPAHRRSGRGPARSWPAAAAAGWEPFRSSAPPPPLHSTHRGQGSRLPARARAAASGTTCATSVRTVPVAGRRLLSSVDKPQPSQLPPSSLAGARRPRAARCR